MSTADNMVNAELSGNAVTAIGYRLDTAGLGGGIANDSRSGRVGTLSISDSSIKDNVANAGGGVYNSGSLAIQRTTITGTFASPDFSAGGGGIANTDRTFTTMSRDSETSITNNIPDNVKTVAGS